MSPLQKFPAGLLGLLNLKTLGRAPQAFSGQVVPTIDASEFYGADLFSVTKQGPVQLLTPSSLSEAVPIGETWRLVGAHVQVNLVPGVEPESAFCALSIGIGRLGGFTFYAASANIDLVNVPSPVVTETALYLGWSAPRGLVLLAGDVVQGNVHATFDAGATAADAYLHVAFQRQPA